jgi:putative hydrolase of the HAD superfamily
MIKSVKGILFDFGATLDTNGRHWYHVVRDAARLEIPNIAEPDFREAYIFTERFLEAKKVIQMDFGLQKMLRAKFEILLNRLADNGSIPRKYKISEFSDTISENCCNFVRRNMKYVVPMLQRLSAHYRLALVTNYYGNVQTILREFAIDGCFSAVAESAVLGVRKPDTAIFRAAIKAIATEPENTIAVGDSLQNDIIPAGSLGCRTVWLRGEGWQKEPDIADSCHIADFIINDIRDLEKITG